MNNIMMSSIIATRRLLTLLPSSANRFYSALVNEHKLKLQKKLEEEKENNEDNKNKKTKQLRELKKWRLDPKRFHKSIFDSMEPESMHKIIVPSKERSFSEWCKDIQLDYLKWHQRFLHERHQTLGNHLATTHFVLYRGGKVRLKNQEEFIKPSEIRNIPASFDPNWEVEEIDFSNSIVVYEGLENLQNLNTLKKINFKNCKYFDDWCLERIVSQCQRIEYLDVSDCPNVSERGLQGLYRAWNLKKLIVTDFKYGPSFELTCFMLEDYLPDLNIEILAPVEVEKKNKILGLF